MRALNSRRNKLSSSSIKAPLPGGLGPIPTGNPTAVPTGTAPLNAMLPAAIVLSGDTVLNVAVTPVGRYEIAGLLPGKYFVVAVEDMDDGAWNDPDVLLRLEATAAPLTVTEGQRVTLALKLK